MVGIAATISIAVYGVGISGWNRTTPKKPSFYTESLHATNTGPADVDITGGSCANTSCAAASPIALSPNVVTRVEFVSSNPCPGNITLTATTVFDNIFNFYVKAC